MQKPYAIILVSRNRWPCTKSVLDSIYFSSQNKKDFDLFIVDNGSDDETRNNLYEYIKSNLTPIKNLFLIEESYLSVALNLGFLVAQNYDWVMKLDNDIIFQNTPQEITPEMYHKQQHIGEGIQYNEAIIAGAISGYTIGAARTKNLSRKKSPKTSDFFNKMISWAKLNNVDIVGLAPCIPSASYDSQITGFNTVQRRGLSCLIGSCMAVSKKCREAIGFFDERIPREVDTEYTQRAMKNAINVGYHPEYTSQHIGSENHTDTDAEKIKKINEVNSLLTKDSQNGFVNTRWQSVQNLIINSAFKNQIINLK